MDASTLTRPGRWWLRLQEVLLLLGCATVSLAFSVEPDRRPASPPDFSKFETDYRKHAFFGYLQPLVADVNAAARTDRDFVAYIAARLDAGAPLSRYEQARLETVAGRYETELEPDSLGESVARLQRRTGAVPVSLVLAQAAKESGWGTSRFAVEGNNLFGQRCYEAGCGLRPRGRPAGTQWGVARFESVRDSLESYVLNLNTHPSYREFRARRQAMRQEGDRLSGIALADSLAAYSERGADYVTEIQAMIRQNGLE